MQNITINLERPVFKEDENGVEYFIMDEYIFSRLTHKDYDAAI